MICHTRDEGCRFPLISLQIDIRLENVSMVTQPWLQKHVEKKTAHVIRWYQNDNSPALSPCNTLQENQASVVIKARGKGGPLL